MAQLRELIVSGPSRFVGASTFNDDIVLNKGATSYADIIPGETSTHSLGNSTYRWNNFYITNINISDTLTTTKNEASTAANIGDIRVAGGIGVAKNSFFGANIYLGSTTYYVNGTAANLPATTIAGLTVAGNLLPSTNVAYKLGSSSKRWLTLYVGNGAEGTAANTGAVQITGGLSTSGKSFMGSDLVISGDIDIQGQNADRFVKFTHTTSSDTGFDWRLGYLGTGNGDANYFVIQSNSTSTTWTDVIRLGLTSFDASFAGNINPRTANTGSIGTSTLKWNKMYATTFYGDLNGNASTATALTTTSAGSPTQPIYFSNGKPVATTYTLGASVPSGAKFTDTTYEAAGSSLGLVKSGGDVTISSGVITVNDDSHNHIISNIDGLQTTLDAKMNNSVQLSGNNLNDVTTPGFYYGGGSNNCTNRPSNVDAFGMEVFKTASGYTTQILTEGNTNAGCRYIRQYNNSTWSSWIPLAEFSSTPTSGQIIIADGSKGKIKTSGYTIATSVPSGAKFTDTWRGIQNNLTSDSTTDSLSAAQGKTLKTLVDGKLEKTTYEYNKELAIGSSGKVCIGKFPCYDSNISVEIKSTTNTTYNGTLIIATQNINTSLGGTYKAVVYGDENNTLTNSIKIEYLSGSNVFSVYINLPAWSKNILHIQCVALAGTPTNIATTVDSIPSTATIVPTNAFTHTHNYAGSASAGGSANSAVKLDSSAGSATHPVYFSNGKPVATTYTLGASVPSGAKFTDTTYSAGTGLSLSGTTFNHSNSVTAGTAQGDASKTLAFGGTFTIPTVTYDAQGHITGKGTTTMTMPANPNTDTHYTTGLYVGANGVKSNAATTNGNTYLKLYDDNTSRAFFKITGSDATTVTSDASGNITISSTDTKVTQTVTTSNSTYPLLLAPNGQTDTATTTAYFDSGVTLNPSTNTIAANISGNATTANKLGTVTVGSGINPIYLNAGTATASTSTVGSGTQPIYLSSGTITASSSTIGSSTKPVYMSSGTITVCGNSLDASVTGSATTVPKALTSNGKTATTSSGYTYGVDGVTSGNRIYSKWYVNLDNGVTTLTDGMLIEIKIPVAGSSSGCAITIDNGTNFHPVIYGSSSIITTHFSANSKILLMYDSTGTGRVYGTINGSTATSAASITGVWRVMNLYTDGNTYTSAYCSTSASTAAKTATCSGYYLLSKSQIHVIITTTNTAARALTLNINGQGAKPIYINGTVSSSSNYTLPRGSYLVYYDGTNYYFRTDGAITGNLIGNASTATKLANARTISLSGSVTGSGTFDGSGNLSIETTTNHTHNYAGSSNAGGGAKFLETFYQNSTTNTYGASWNFLAQWINGDRLKFKIINNGTIQNSYSIEVDHAYKLVDSSTSKNASAAPLSIGSGTQPVYFSNGVPVAATYTLGKSVPSNAVFTDTKVTQTSVSASDYTNWRPLVIGSSNSGTEGFTPSTVTDTTITASTISCQPSSGTIKATIFKGALSGNADTATKCVGSYTGNGGQQNPNYFGTNRIGFLMMNTIVNNNDDFKDWMIMDCYVSNDVGGSVAFGINRQRLGAYIMRSTAERNSWTESAELLHTSNYNSYALPLSGGTMSGNIILPYNQSIIQHQLSEPNYTTSIMWYKGGVSQKKYNPSIGHFNIGDTDGAMILLPYATDSQPWDSLVGLYLSKNKLLYNGKSIQITAGYGTSNPTATNYPVGSVYYKLI